MCRQTVDMYWLDKYSNPSNLCASIIYAHSSSSLIVRLSYIQAHFSPLTLTVKENTLRVLYYILCIVIIYLS